MYCLPRLRLIGLALLFSLSVQAADYRVIGQPDLASDTLASRCADSAAQFNKNSAFDSAHGPSGIFIDPRNGRIFVTDFGGNRVLSWTNVDALNTCQAADQIIGNGLLNGPEAVTFDPANETLFVADTLNHAIRGFRMQGANWQLAFTLGTPTISGAGQNQFTYPRGLALDPQGRLFVADDYNRKVKIFAPPYANQQASVDSIGAGNNGGFISPKAVAMSGNTLFVADYGDPAQGIHGRVLRFTGPFDNPASTYTASGEFGGLTHPVDLTIHPDGRLLVTDHGANPRIVGYYEAVVGSSQAGPGIILNENLHNEPLGIATDRAGRVYIADYQAYRVLIRDEFTRTTPVNAQSSAATSALLADLHDRVNRDQRRTLIGQQLKAYDAASWDESMQLLRNRALPLPKVVGGDIGELGYAYMQDVALNGLLAYGAAGHVISLSWHPLNPVTGGNAWTTPLTAAQIRSLRDRQTVAGQAWQAQLDAAATILQRFENAGIPVIIRPLHEQNGTWFWWGHDGSKGSALRERQAAWVGLWRDLVTEFAQRKGLNNLIFGFTPGATYLAPPMTYYPGADWVDIAGFDVYDNELDLGGDTRGLQHYSAVVGSGKPFVLGEFSQTVDGNGPGEGWDARTLTQRITDSYPRTVLALSWVNSPPSTWDLARVSHNDELLIHPLIDTMTSAAQANCGSAQGIPVTSAPSANLCAPGVASAITTAADHYTWFCNHPPTSIQCTAPRHYTLTTQTSGIGSISIAPNQTSYAYNSQVSLSAQATTGHVFGAWSGSCSGTRSTCTLSMNAHHSVGASFAAPTENHFSRMYLAAFLRAADLGGMNYWSNQISNEGQSYQRVGGTIFSLSVVTAIYPSGMSDTAFVEAIYNNVFGRASDAEGLNYWVNELATLRNAYTAQGSGNAMYEARGQLVMNMINAGLGTVDGTPGKAYIDNRFQVALYASERQRVLGREIPPATLRSISDQVNADTASVALARTAIDNAL